MPNRSSTLINLAATQINLEKEDEALFNLNKPLKIDPNNHLALMNISNIYSNNKFDDALSFIEKAISLDSQNTGIF